MHQPPIPPSPAPPAKAQRAQSPPDQHPLDQPCPELLGQLELLGQKALGAPPQAMLRLTGGGSDRVFYRLESGLESGAEGSRPAGKPTSAVAAVCADDTTCRQFLGLTRHLAGKGIPVPRILASNPEQRIYLMQDLGPQTLAQRIALWHGERSTAGRTADGAAARPAPAPTSPPKGQRTAQRALEGVVRWLPTMQLRGAQGLDRRLIAENPILDGAGYRADLELFCQQYAEQTVPAVQPGPQALAALWALADRVGRLPAKHFCHRDFQTRNVMWLQGRPVFLDYQSGTLGPLAYDLASLLYSPDSRLDEAGRTTLISAYLEALADCASPEQCPDRNDFLGEFYAIVLLRRLQALGAYARIAQAKAQPHYLARVPATLTALDELIQAGRFDHEQPALRDWLNRLVALPPQRQSPPEP